MRYVVTGANRGIGLELVRQLSQRGDEVVAATRDPAGAKALAALAAGANGSIRVLACDVGDDESVHRFASELGSVAVDVLINNAGIMGKMQAFADLDLDDVRRTFDVNTLGPIRVTRALLPHLGRGTAKRIVQISSGMGSITDNGSGGAYGYRMSKAALNMANKSLSRDFAGKGFVCVVINPGWVQTDMGGASAATPVDESVRGILGKVDALGPSDTGRFLDFKKATDYPY